MIQPREPSLSDLPGIYRMCRETAASNTSTNQDLVGHIYAGPYVVRHPYLARVIADDTGVAGYILGCPDTRRFEAWGEQNWWPRLRAQYPLGAGDTTDAEMIRLLHSPPRSPDELVADYPAHLHIDLLPRAQGQGYGRVLIEWLCAELASRGIPGVHLGVGADNARAIGFYGHLGFARLPGDEGAVWMGKRL